VKARDVLAEALDPTWAAGPDATLAALSERAGGGGFYVDEDGGLWRARPNGAVKAHPPDLVLIATPVPTEEPAPS
jgi:hypothetical protein